MCFCTHLLITHPANKNRIIQVIDKEVIVFKNSALQAVEQTLKMERTVHRHLLDVHKTADRHGDAQMTDFIEGEYLEEQFKNQGLPGTLGQG